MPTFRSKRTAAVGLATVVALALEAVTYGGSAGATSYNGAGPIKEFAPFPTLASYPCEVAVDNAGNLWTDQFLGNGYGRVDPTTGAVSEIKLPNPGGLPGGQNRGPDGDIWFVEAGGNALGRLHPATQTISTIPFPWDNVSGVTSIPGLGTIQNGAGVSFDDSFGKDGKLYFTLVGLNSIGSYDLTTRTFEKFDIPTPASGPIAMEKGPGNTIAVAEGTANKLGLYDVFTKQYTEYPIPTPGSLPGGLTVSPDDSYLYFGETLGNKIGRLEFATGQIKEYDLVALRSSLLGTGLPNGNPLPNPGQLRFGTDGKLYFVEGTFSFGSRIGQLDVNTSEYNELSTPTPLSSPCDLNNTVPGKIYFGEFTGNRIAYFDIPNTTDISNTFPLYG
jgi:virginiamycin B lyase